MKIDETSEIPIFLQISREIENAILSGSYQAGDRIPSTTELSLAYRINPATALKGINLLVDESILYKQRGLGVFVCREGPKKIKEKRAGEFKSVFLKPLIREAERLEISKNQIIEWLKEEEADGTDKE